MTEFNRFIIEYNGYRYIAEFDTDTVKRCEDMGVLENKEKPIEFTFICFYASILKNQPHVSVRKARELFDAVIKDEEYGISAFDDIVEEFTTLYSMLFTVKSGKKKFGAEPSTKFSVPTGK